MKNGIYIGYWGLSNLHLFGSESATLFFAKVDHLKIFFKRENWQIQLDCGDSVRQCKVSVGSHHPRLDFYWGEFKIKGFFYLQVLVFLINKFIKMFWKQAYGSNS